MKKNGKYCSKKGMNLKPLALLLALTLLVGCAIGGTIAWLTAKTDPVINTFTVGDVNITLLESKVQIDEDGNYILDEEGNLTYGANPEANVANEYPLIPGNTYKKDPVVAVVEKDGVVSEDCWLFVKFEETADAKTYLTYTSTLTAANQWIQGKGTDGIPANVWYREVKKTDAVKSWHLLADDTITINAETVRKDTMNDAAEQELKYTAYAAQSANLSAADAWKQFTP